MPIYNGLSLFRLDYINRFQLGSKSFLLRGPSCWPRQVGWSEVRGEDALSHLPLILHDIN